MEKCVVYLHGWRGNPESDTKRAVAEAFPGLKVIGLPIDFEAPLWKTEHELTVGLIKIFDHYRHDEVVIFGNSAGGFWARHLANVFHTHLILTNPSLNLAEGLAKYDVAPELLEDYRDFHPAAKGHLNHLVFLSEDDDVVDGSLAAWTFKNVVMLPDEGHRIKNFTPVINKMKEMFDEEFQPVPGRAVH